MVDVGPGGEVDLLQTIRERLGLQPGTLIEWSLQGKTIVLRVVGHSRLTTRLGVDTIHSVTSTHKR